MQRLLLHFVNVDLSASYLEIAKDRLYLDHRSGYRRRTCQVNLTPASWLFYMVPEQVKKHSILTFVTSELLQTVLVVTLLTILPLLAPLTPHLAEEVFHKIPKSIRRALQRFREKALRTVLEELGVSSEKVNLPMFSVFQASSVGTTCLLLVCNIIMLTHPHRMNKMGGTSAEVVFICDLGILQAFPNYVLRTHLVYQQLKGVEVLIVCF